jgi:hypothetical protein
MDPSQTKEAEAAETQEIQKLRPQYRRETPAVLKSYPSLLRGQQELKIRILQYSKSDPILDIREFVTSEEFSGFTKKGLALDLSQVELLQKIIKEALPDLKPRTTPVP